MQNLLWKIAHFTRDARRLVDAALRAAFGLALYKRQFGWRAWITVTLYFAFVLAAMWLAADRPTPALLSSVSLSSEATLKALQELAKSYSPVFFDVAIVVGLGVLFLGAYRSGFRSAADFYKRQQLKEASCNGFEPVVVPIEADCEIRVALKDDHFAFPPVLACTIAASSLSSGVLFQSTQGGFDLAKLTLVSVLREAGALHLELGTCSFRDLNIAHYWAFVPVASESSDETDQRQKSLFDLIGSAQRDRALHIAESVQGRFCGFAPPALAPNPLGVSVFLRVRIDGRAWWLMRLRKSPVAADKLTLCAAVAGLVDVLPEFAARGPGSARALIHQECHDEVVRLIRPNYQDYFDPASLPLRPLGFVFDVDGNYQPELYFCADIDLS